MVIALRIKGSSSNRAVIYTEFFFIWFVRLLALRPRLAYCASLSGDSEDDCGEADGM
jgi:hypothetical protein